MVFDRGRENRVFWVGGPCYDCVYDHRGHAISFLIDHAWTMHSNSLYRHADDLLNDLFFGNDPDLGPYHGLDTGAVHSQTHFRHGG